MKTLKMQLSEQLEALQKKIESEKKANTADTSDFPVLKRTFTYKDSTKF